MISSTRYSVDIAAKEYTISHQTGSFALVQTGGTYQNVGNGLSITIPKTGLYRISCKFDADIGYTTNNANTIIYRLAVDGAEINGTPGAAYKNSTGNASFSFPVFIEAPVDVYTAGQVITLQGYKTNTDICQIYYSAGMYEGFLEAELLTAWVPVNTESSWQEYALTIGAVTAAPTKGTIAYDKAVWRRNGANMDIMYTYRQTGVGTSGTGTYLFPIPAGYTIDTTLMETIATSGYNTTGVCGTVGCYNGANHYPGTAHVYNSTNIQLMYGSSAGMISSTAMNLNSSAILTISFKASVPIVEFA